MKTVLFCTKPDSYNILKPIADELEKQKDKYIWYVIPALFDEFPYKHQMHTNSLRYLDDFKADVIFTPKDTVPYWLHGLKVHIFDSLIEHEEKYRELIYYFDLYLTPGPHFTNIFENLAQEYKTFSVIETGWSKLDTLFQIANDDNISWERNNLIQKYGVKYIILYAPSSDMKFSSVIKLKDIIIKLSSRQDILFMVMFDRYMAKKIIEEYKEITTPNVLILDDHNVSKNMHIADILISDTTSLVYEFILLDKPVLTVDTKLKNITWLNQGASGIFLNVVRTLENRVGTRNRRSHQTIQNYHPYNDGKSAKRVVDVIKEFIKNHEIPEERKVPFLKKWKIKREFRRD
jgi:hypothetical protein